MTYKVYATGNGPRSPSSLAASALLPPEVAVLHHHRDALHQLQLLRPVHALAMVPARKPERVHSRMPQPVAKV